MPYAKHVTSKKTPVPQSKPLDKRQVRNSAGGHTYALDKWEQLDRFLILGSAGGTFYVGEQKLTKENAKVVDDCLRENHIKTVQRIADISDSGRAPKNEPAIFALALAASATDSRFRREALAALPKVCRIPTHLFQFVAEADQLRGWGRGLRRAVGDWYNEVPVDKLAYHVVKYQQRDGWANRDLLRLSHAAPKVGRGGVFRYVVKGDPGRLKVPEIIDGFEAAKTEKAPKKLAGLVRKFGLTREMVPTEALNEPIVWEALLEKMPLHATVRNLGKMTSIGVLGAPNGRGHFGQTTDVIKRLTDRAYVQGSRMHPLAVLIASKQYAAGHGNKGKLTWKPIDAVVNALDEAFYLAFDNVTPTNKRIMLALDVSGSMGSAMIGDTNITAREATAALALVTAKTEPHYGIVAFSSGRNSYGSGRSKWAGHDASISPIDIGPTMRLADAVKVVEDLPFGGTDCALPMLYAKERRLGVDAFVILTDNETWAGDIHPKAALASYRADVVHGAKLIVCGMTATGFTINDPSDPLGLDVVGFDAAVPAIINNFISGDLTAAK